jgi:hypothetical protein
MAVKKGYSNPGIGSHGKAIAVDDVSSSLDDARHPSSEFAADPSNIPAADGAKVFKFPLDDVSAGNFWTRLIINSWVPVKRESDQGETGQISGLDKDSLANIWLPMPLTLNTEYGQKYSEVDNMTVNRGSGEDIRGYSGFGASFMAQGQAVLGGAASEFANFASSMANVNNSGKMAMGSIQNQMMGLVYDGASLRSHSLSWRMIPKNREEQNAIQTVCYAFKKFAAPVVKGPLGGDTNFAKSAEAHKKATAEIDENSKDGVKFVFPAMAGKDDKAVTDSMRNIGRLGIPVTVNVEFWYGAKRNPHLFQIKDSFIERVAVNYTPTGTWNAYEDGAPIETQLDIVLKENAIITQDDIDQVGGY